VPPARAIALLVAGLLSLGAILYAAAGLSRNAAREAVYGVPAGARGEGFEGSLMPPGVRAPDFRLRDQDGRPISMAALRGRPVIVTFLYTTCTESCPVQAQQIKLALDRVGRPVPAVAVSVEPDADTPASARRFLRKQGMVGRMSFALGTRSELEPVWKGFAIQPQVPDAEHQARTVIVDARGFQRIGFPVQQLTPERLAKDVRTLLTESRAGRSTG
jgi:protein SCO1/2